MLQFQILLNQGILTQTQTRVSVETVAVEDPWAWLYEDDPFQDPPPQQIPKAQPSQLILIVPPPQQIASAPPPQPLAPPNVPALFQTHLFLQFKPLLVKQILSHHHFQTLLVG